MKKLFTILLITATMGMANAQPFCDNVQAAGISYILTKGVAADYSVYLENGFTTGLGIAYSVAAAAQGETRPTESGNSLDLFAFVGYRVWREDYVVSVYVNGGLVMGNVAPLQPMASVKILFPMNNKAISIEPFYVLDRQLTGRITIYFRL